MITFLLAALSYVTGSPVPGTVYWLTGLVDGLLFIPLTTVAGGPILGRFVREKLARLHHLQAVAPLWGVVLILLPTGYEVAPVEEVGKERFAFLADGRRLELGDEVTWYRLGNRHFGVSFEPVPEVLGDLAVDEDDIELAADPVVGEEGDVTGYQAVTSGDRAVLKKKHGGLHGYTPLPPAADGDEEVDRDGVLVSLSLAVDSVREGGAVLLSERTERVTRMDKGGGANLSNKARVYAYIGTTLIAAIVGTVIFGVL